MNSTQEKIRLSNFELLRIIAMLMIVACHAVGHGGGTLQTSNSFITVRYITNLLLASWGQLGVCVFIIISSWFLCDADGIHLKKIIIIYFQTLLITLIICFVFKVFRIETFGIKQIVKSFFTPLYQWTGYWFIRTYLNFYLLVPILQKVVKTTSDEALGKIVLITTIVIPGVMLIFFQQNVKELGEFIYLFFLTAYLKRKKNNVIERKPEIFLLFAFFLTIISLFVFDYLNLRYEIRDFSDKLFYRSFPTYSLAIFLFYFAKKYWNFKSKFINSIAKTTLGIYVLHENPLFYFNEKQPFLFCRVFKVGQNSSELFYPIYLILVVLIVFIVCSIIESIRIILIDRNLIEKNRFLNKICIKFDNWYKL